LNSVEKVALADFKFCKISFGRLEYYLHVAYRNDIKNGRAFDTPFSRLQNGQTRLFQRGTYKESWAVLEHYSTSCNSELVFSLNSLSALFAKGAF